MPRASTPPRFTATASWRLRVSVVLAPPPMFADSDAPSEQPRRVANHTVVIIALSVVALLVNSGALARAQTDDPLQGRVLQNEDGTLFAYSNGQRYLIQTANVGDDTINAIPIAGSVERLDVL